MFKNIRVLQQLFGVASVIFIYTLTACQVSSQKPAQDLVNEPPASPTPLPTIQKKTADSDTPASGICVTPTEDIVLITIAQGAMPDPRCVKVTLRQRLQFNNGTAEVLRLQLGILDLELQPGETKTFATPCGDFLEDGVHHAVLSAGSAPEIWLVGSP